MVPKRKTLKRVSKSGDGRMASTDGRLAFTLARSSLGIYVERIETVGRRHITHSMLVRTAGDFALFLETDSGRFDEPGLYHQVQQRVGEMLDVGS
jgi:hypothetical protein